MATNIKRRKVMDRQSEIEAAFREEMQRRLESLEKQVQALQKAMRYGVED